MQVSIETGEGLERRMTVELPAEKVRQEVDKRLQNMTRTVRIDGFRPGKAPLRVIRQRYGQPVRQDVIGDLIQSSFFEAAAKENLKPAGLPRIDDLDVDAARYTAVFEVMPEVEPVDMSGITLKRPKVEVTDTDVDAMVENLRRQRASWAMVERAAAHGDQVLISFKGFIGGEAFEGGSAENVPVVLGVGSLINGFEEGLVGAQAGDNRSLELKFPEDYRVQSLAGKDATFEVELKEVRQQVLPEIDADFVKSFGVQGEDLAALQADVRMNMERELRQKLRSSLKERVLEALFETNKLDLPQAMVDEQATAMRDQTKQSMKQRGQTSSFELPIELFRDQARRRVAVGLLVAEIIKRNDIKVDQERVRTTIEEFAQSYEKPAEFIDQYSNNAQYRSSVEHLVLEDQVVDWVMGQVQVEDESFDFNGFMNPKGQE
ncbi:MAG: trigger factor [Gammaproteobacteria bacterium]|nr:trigger factor [Gammaproteobacteria bacterium]MBU1655941.1 trigger factor [Gammaproteobacteria bacterium]MBU1960662.1 trigger factor [Gammaproteobacteria bacterium]